MVSRGTQLKSAMEMEIVMDMENRDGEMEIKVSLRYIFLLNYITIAFSSA